MSSEYDVEPIPGLPERPPEGESILWQGAPEWSKLAVRAFHVRKVAIYFFIVWLWLASRAAMEGISPLAAVISAGWVWVPAVAAMLLLTGLAWLYARMTVYTITSQRVAIRSGIALPTTTNLPFKIVESAGLKLFDDGTGDVSLQLEETQNASYIVLWPNVRPWYMAQPEPTFRSVADAGKVSEILATALTNYVEPETPMPRVQQASSELDSATTAQSSGA